MSIRERLWFAAAGLSGAVAVAAEAIAAHKASEAAGALISTGARLQLVHAVALLAIGLAARVQASGIQVNWAVKLAGIAFFLGSVLFSGALYLRAFGEGWAGSLAPTGGTILILGWVLLVMAAFVPQRQT